MLKRSLTIISLICALLCVLLPLEISAQNDSGREVVSAFDRARAAYRTRDYKLARRELEKALQLNSQMADAHLLSALISWQEKKYAAGIKGANQAIHLAPNNSLAHYTLARLLFENDQRDDALKSAKKAIELGAEYADAYILNGDIELSLNRIQLAIEAYQKGISLPAPNQYASDAFRRRFEALQNLMEFQAHSTEPGYEWPKRLGYDGKPIDLNQLKSLEAFVGASQLPKRTLGVVVLADGGHEQLLVLGNTGKLPVRQVGVERKIKQPTVHIQCTPAKKHGKPVLFWFRWEQHF